MPPTSTVSPNASSNSAASSTTTSVPRIKAPTHFNRYFDNWWAWEISAGLLAVICLTTIMIVLAVFDGKPQPEMRWGITLNALIALIVTVMKGGSLTPLMEGMAQLKWVVFARDTRPLIDFNVYDGASRGGLNALFLFWHLRRRFWREATALAALFYFLSFGVDTFAQQLIQTQYQNANVTSSTPPTLARAQRYDSYLQLAVNDGSILPDGLEADMLAAVYTPLYATKLTDQSDLFNCPESNCTYPIVPSIAVCGQCNDLADKLIKDTWAGGDIFSLPQGPEVTTTVAMNVTSTMEPNRTNSFTNKVALIASFAYVNFTNTMICINGTCTDAPVQAGECALFPCVQEYQTSVTRNIINQTVIREWSGVKPRRITNSTMTALGQWDYWYDINVPTPGMQGASAEIGFNMSIQSFLALQNATVPLLQGDAVMASGGVDYGVISSSFIMQRLYNTPNMSDLINRLATTMTSSIRRHPATGVMVDPGNQTQIQLPVAPINQPLLTGQTTRLVAFVQIKWAWIVLPAITVLFSNLFLVFAILKTMWAQKVVDVGVWKSSSLPILYHGLDAAAITRANVDPVYSTRVAYMEENACQLRVRLNAGGGDLKLS